MIFDFALQVLLAPVLLIQGVYLHKRAKSLPEAPGHRSRKQGDGPVLRLLIIGDSSAAGVGVSDMDVAIMGQLTGVLARTHRVECDLVAQTGARAVDALDWLNDLPNGHYDVVLTSFGVNDVTKLTPLRRWLRQQAALLDRLTQNHGAQLILVTGLPPMGRFPVLPNPLRWVVGRRANRFDRAIQAAVAGRSNCAHIFVDPTLDPQLMADDGYHPGPQVNTIWANWAAEAVHAHFASLDDAKVPA